MPLPCCDIELLSDLAVIFLKPIHMRFQKFQGTCHVTLHLKRQILLTGSRLESAWNSILAFKVVG